MVYLLHNLSLSLALAHALRPTVLQYRQFHNHTRRHLPNRYVLLDQRGVHANPHLSLDMAGHLLCIITPHLRLGVMQVARLC